MPVFFTFGDLFLAIRWVQNNIIYTNYIRVMGYSTSVSTPVMYSCEKCDFHSSNKKDYRRHLLTRKHETVHDVTTENTIHLYTCICGKSYRFSQGLSRHKRTCKRVIQDIHNGDHLDLKGMFLEAMQQNKELQNALITKQEQISDRQQQMSN